LLNDKSTNKFSINYLGNTLDVDELKFMKTAANYKDLFATQNASISTKISSPKSSSFYEIPLKMKEGSQNENAIKRDDRNRENQYLNFPLQNKKNLSSNMNLCNNNIFVNFQPEMMFQGRGNIECSKCKIEFTPNEFPIHILKVFLTYCSKSMINSNKVCEKDINQSKEKCMESEV